MLDNSDYDSNQEDYDDDNGDGDGFKFQPNLYAHENFWCHVGIRGLNIVICLA